MLAWFIFYFFCAANYTEVHQSFSAVNGYRWLQATKDLETNNEMQQELELHKKSNISSQF